MSRKTDLLGDLKNVGAQLGGAHLTRQARNATFATFVTTMQKAGFGIRSADQIGGRHLRAFASALQQKGMSARTQANQMSHIRTVLETVGKTALARNPEFSNAKLGIEKGSRIGTKGPMPESRLQTFRDRMNESGRASVGITLALQHVFGLRETEAIRGGRADVLARWEKELAQKGIYSCR